MYDDDEIREQKIARHSVIDNLAKNILQIQSKVFFRYPEWGNLDFSDCIDIFEEKVKPIVSEVQKYGMHCFSPEDYEIVGSSLNGVMAALNSIRSFSIEIENPHQRRTDLKSHFLDMIRKFEATIAPYTMALLLRRIASNENVEELSKIRQRTEEIFSSIEAAQNEMQNKIFEMTNIVDSSRIAAGNLGVEKHAQIFLEHSKSMSRASTKWLVAAGLVVCASLSIATHFYLHPMFLLGDMSMSVQVVVTKIIIMSLLVSAAVWCGKNYRATAHEASVNQHRANALSTFRTFVEATDEPDIRNAVLLEATRSIFAQAQSGFLDKGEVQGSDTRILEVVRSLSSISRSSGS